MVRYSNRRYKRRSYRRNKALSTARIFGKTSAKSQAKQIYALKKSINKIHRKFRPETYTHHINVDSHTFSNSSLATSYYSNNYVWPQNGTGDENKRGDKIYVKSMQLNFTFEYYNNSNTGYHTTESSGCPVRIIVLKTKQPCLLTDMPHLDDVLLYSSYQGDEYTQRAVSPYVHGITDKYKILYNKVFYMTPQMNQKALRVFLKPGLIQWETDSSATHVFYYVCPCGLHSDVDFSENILMTVSAKIAYIDY